MTRLGAKLRLDRWIAIWVMVTSTLVLALIATTVALIATSHANSVGRCTNEVLAVRDEFNRADHDAEVAKVTGQVKGLRELQTDPRAGVAQFIAASEGYLKQIAINDDARKQHPLGKC